jgi:hypothetical protein
LPPDAVDIGAHTAPDPVSTRVYVYMREPGIIGTDGETLQGRVAYAYLTIEEAVVLRDELNARLKERGVEV